MTYEKLSDCLEFTKRAVLVPGAIGTFETPLGHGTPYHKFVVTLENATLVYHAFSYGKMRIDERNIVHVDDTHVGDTPGGLEEFLKAPSGKVLGAGTVHVTGHENKCLSFNSIGTRPYVYPLFESTNPEQVPSVPIVVIEQLLAPWLVREYGKLFPSITHASSGGQMPPLWELWEGLLHPLYLKAVKDLTKNTHHINSVGCQASWRLWDDDSGYGGWEYCGSAIVAKARR